MELIIQYLRRPFQDSDWPKKIGIGGLIGLIPGLISLISFKFSFIGCLVVSFLYLGYLLEWLISIYRESDIAEHLLLPEWKEWGKLLANGLIVFVIILLYCLLPLILLWIGSSMETLGGASAILGHLFEFLAWLGFTTVSFILPAVLIQFAHSGKIESAYHIKTIGEKIAGVFPEYLLSYLFSLGLVILTWIIVAVLSYIILGYVFAPVLNFYIGIVIAYRFSKLLGSIKKEI